MAKEVKTTCPYCGVGCGVIASVADDGAVSVRGDPDHPANFGRLCSKGSALAETIDLDGRLLEPEVNGKKVGWDRALDLVARRFSETIAGHGPDSVAFYLSGQLLTEDYYVANKLMKGFIGSANIDTNSRLCMASSVAGHRRAFGSDTVPGTYEDLELADVVILVGSNLVWCHPVLAQRLAAAKEARPEMKIVLVDPRRTMTADLADLHLAIRPDSDAALFNGLLGILNHPDCLEEHPNSPVGNSPHLDRDFIENHTCGFEEALAAAGCPDLDEIAHATGLNVRELSDFYSLFLKNEKTVTVYSQGVNQSEIGTDKVNSIINCHLATGRIGKPGMGPFSVTGQPNAMGGREVGGLANMLAAHMAIENPEHLEIVQGFWNSPTISSTPGLKAVDLFKAVKSGKIKALWIMATNPVDSMPEADDVKAAIVACPFVVVSDVLEKTDTLELAHVKLPAAAWGEKDGTVTNSERRISRQRPFLPLPGSAHPDWWIVTEVARRMGFASAFDYDGPAEIFAEHSRLSAYRNNGDRDFDIGAYAEIDRQAYDGLQPFQWPQRAGEVSETKRFFADGAFYTADGRARFVPVSGKVPDRHDPDYPFTLNTGRVRDHWHTMTRTGKAARLSSHMAEPFAELHPDDASVLGIAPAELVRLISSRGEVIVRALVTDRQQPGSIFVPMHWTDQFASKGRIDALVKARTDPYSGQPASKNARVRAERFAASAYAFAILAEKPNTIPADYWALARCNGGFRVEIATSGDAPDWSSLLQDWCKNPDAEMLSYRDSHSGEERFALFAGAKLLGAIFVARNPVAVSRSWAVEQLETPHEDTRQRFAVIAGRAGADQPDKGPIVCSCFGVGASQIVRAAGSGCHNVETIGKSLKAGTNCGSCRAEIRSILQAQLPIAAE
ncbi:molybdopterin-dependent oxidoreductase [Stappia sp. GBMRC 2046]|uniref:nitrate reductase (cytochrome) n=1 Tax=Stappia sediminis TaxID=2692190 RepID=A0A7X3LWG3_9HYPH|nr:nitrate reductase [Stappia sediminis]MXN66318.1 molybdopterin-dependent oxidoreductase [Stappia sediminis]